MGLIRGHYGVITTGSLRGYYGAITGLYDLYLIALFYARAVGTVFHSSRHNPGTSIMFRNYSLEIELQFIFNCSELIP